MSNERGWILGLTVGLTKMKEKAEFSNSKTPPLAYILLKAIPLYTWTVFPLMVRTEGTFADPLHGAV